MVGTEKFFKATMVAMMVMASPALSLAQARISEPELRLGDLKDPEEAGLLILRFKVTGTIENPDDARYEILDGVDGWAIHDTAGLQLQEDGTYLGEAAWHLDFAQCSGTSSFTVSLLGEATEEEEEPAVLSSINTQITVPGDYCTEAGIFVEEGED